MAGDAAVIAVERSTSGTREGGPRAAFPQLGVNAADACVGAQTAIGLLRQHTGDETASTAS